MTELPELSILLLGSTSRAEFQDVRPTLEGFGQVVVAEKMSAALERISAGGIAPDLIVIAQSYPGQFAHDAVDQLRRLAPVARLLALLGSWCEGEMRTGQPWPAAIRVYWHGWESQATRELGSLAAGSCGTWALPPTASEEERILRLADQPLDRRQGCVAICARQTAMWDWIASACRRRGYRPVWIAPDSDERPDIDAIVFDAAHGTGEELDWLNKLASSLDSTPIIALLDFPRIEDRVRLLAAGAAAVLAKPFLVEDLFWQLDRVTQYLAPS